MDEGESDKFFKKEEDNSSEEYEYVDEQGNPVDTSRLDEYELVDEQEEIEAPAQENIEASSHQDNYEKSIEEYRPENKSSEYEKILKEDIADTPYQELKPKPQETLQRQTEIQRPIQTFQQNSNQAAQLVKSPAEIDTQHMLHQAKLAQDEQRSAQRRIETKKDNFDNDANEDMLRRLSMPGNNQQREFLERFAPSEAKEKPKIQQPVTQTKKDNFDNDANEDMLRRVSMSTKTMQGAAPVRDTSEDSREKPLIYKKGHPHLGMTFNMDTITNLTERLFNSDKGFRTPDSKKKRV